MVSTESVQGQVASVDSAENSATKRRRLRRGTSSCWECKRRKVRCDFDADFTGACVTCRRRGTRCVLQDVPEDELLCDQGGAYRDVEEGIVRVEAMVERMIHGPEDSSTVSQVLSRKPKQLTTLSSDATNTLVACDDQETVGYQEEISYRKREISKPRTRRLLPLVHNSSKEATLYQPPQGSWPPNRLGQQPTIGPPGPFSLSRTVYSHLPPIHVTIQILRRGKLRSFPIQMLRKPLMSFLKRSDGEDQSSPSEVLEPTAQPVAIARKLIQLAICLQQMDPVLDASQLCLDGSTRDVATRFFNAASSYVTSHDPLIVSLDGLETLMLEGHFHLSSGKYKLAWLVFQRAMGIAQLLGLHSPPSERQHSDCEDQHGDFIWFRLTYMNRFLSMMLSLPIANAGIEIASPEQLARVPDLEKLERLHASAMGRIATRNEYMRLGDHTSEILYDHYRETQDIDYELKQAARSKPARWWTTPSMREAGPEMETKEDTARLVFQIHQYNLLTSLHAPYLIPGARTRAVQGGPPPDYTYSMVTALSASRESLVRFPILSRSKLIPFSVRGMNFKAFISATTLLLAHIDGHRLDRGNVHEHQRPGDLGMIDNVIEVLDAFADRRSDYMDRSSVRVLRKLLEIEEDAASGNGYDVWSEAPAVGEIDCIMELKEDEVELMVPTVGTIHITRQAEPRINSSNKTSCTIRHLNTACKDDLGTAQHVIP